MPQIPQVQTSALKCMAAFAATRCRDRDLCVALPVVVAEQRWSRSPIPRSLAESYPRAAPQRAHAVREPGL